MKQINFTPPYELEEKNVVDNFLIFDTDDDMVTKKSLDEILKILKEKNND